MVGQSAPIGSKARARFRALNELGCIVTLVYFNTHGTPGDIHHVLNQETGRRYDDEHEHTICLTPWYHRGQPPSNRFGTQLSIATAERSFGPSMALNRPAFVARFGTDVELLEMTNALLQRLASV